MIFKTIKASQFMKSFSKCDTSHTTYCCLIIVMVSSGHVEEIVGLFRKKRVSSGRKWKIVYTIENVNIFY